MTTAPSFLESLHYVPDADWSRSAYGVVRAGKVSAAPDYRISRDVHIGQDILYCLSGAGSVGTSGRKLRIEAGQVVWIANEFPHFHEADAADPWTLLWFRLNGPNAPVLRRKLFGDRVEAVEVPEWMALESWFERLFRAMRAGGPAIDFRLNQLVGEFLAIMDLAMRGHTEGELPDPLNALVAAMRGDLGAAWTSETLSAISRLSESQVRRLFKRHLRASPHQWLLRERLSRAQTLMSDSPMPLAEIAEQCGFCDVYHFSREFKRSIGTPPAAWRRKELGRAGQF